MREKLLLAVTLTFALSLFTELNWFSSARTATNRTNSDLSAFTVTLRQ
ncbi:MAG: hypothetical protein KME46_17370 [Brasilonema angustatum HA4187-MV1]|jgi:hypothetical protein|nr:hypothetical protein [Brasilonema angustatum HA4187-MV1]